MEPTLYIPEICARYYRIDPAEYPYEEGVHLPRIFSGRLAQMLIRDTYDELQKKKRL